MTRATRDEEAKTLRPATRGVRGRALRSYEQHSWYKEMRAACPGEDECWIFPGANKAQIEPSARWREVYGDKKVHPRKYLYILANELSEADGARVLSSPLYCDLTCNARCVNPAHVRIAPRRSTPVDAVRERSTSSAGRKMLRAYAAHYLKIAAWWRDPLMPKTNLKEDNFHNWITDYVDAPVDPVLWKAFCKCVVDMMLAGEHDLLWKDRAGFKAEVAAEPGSFRNAPALRDDAVDLVAERLGITLL